MSSIPMSLLQATSCGGKPWPVSNPINPNPPYYVHYDKGAVTTFQFNTATIPNGQYDFGLNLLDASGNWISAVHHVGQPDHDQVLTAAKTECRRLRLVARDASE